MHGKKFYMTGEIFFKWSFFFQELKPKVYGGAFLQKSFNDF